MNGEDLPVRQSVLGRAAQRGGVLRVLRRRTTSAESAATGTSVKLCECGCGQVTRIVPWNCARDGSIKGQPRRFVSGHNTQRGRSTNAYTETNGGIRTHRYLAELALGRPLPKGAEVHHLDGNNDERSVEAIGRRNCGGLRAGVDTDRTALCDTAV